ncbi:MAG: hypothetical protein KJ566_00760 [Nanoarchaeota archaeon]|nr:hypothetical protein [Nanoarchaeota archaeon]
MTKSKTILGIEIHGGLFKEILEKYITSMGYSLNIVNGNGEMTEELKHPEKYACAIVDGIKSSDDFSKYYEACEKGIEIASQLTQKGLTTIVLSGADKNIINKCREQIGKNGIVLRKPFDFEVLKNYIENASSI